MLARLGALRLRLPLPLRERAFRAKAENARVRGRAAGALFLTIAATLAIAALLLPPRGVPTAEMTEPATHIAVADLRGQALYVLDLARPQDARRIALPAAPHELACLPDGRLVASLEQAGLLAVVNVTTGAVETVALGGLPHGLAVERDTLLVTDREAGAVRHLHLADWSEERTLYVGRWPHAIALLPGGGLAVADGGDSTVTLAGYVLAAPEVAETVAVASDGRVATAGALADSVRIYAPDGSTLLDVAVGGRPVRVAWASDGRTLAVALSAAGAVALVDTATAEVRRVPLGGLPDGLLYLPTSGGEGDGRLLAGDLNAGRLTVIAGDEAQSTVLPGARSTGTLLGLARSATGTLGCPGMRQ